MSYVKEEKINPATRFYEWDGKDGGFRYWDKNKGEKGERVHVDLPFVFVPIHTLATVKGFSKIDNSGFWANEVQDLRTDTLTVRTKKGVKATGLYATVKATSGVKFCQSVYIMEKQDGKNVLANIQFIGAAVSAWIEFRKKHKDIYAGAIRVASMIEGKNGANVFQSPVFEMIPISEAGRSEAMRLGKELSNYLDSYFARSGQPAKDDTGAYPVDEMPLDSDIQDAPEYDGAENDGSDLPF